MSHYAIGIDLGTTNSVLAFAELSSTTAPAIAILLIPQWIAPGTLDSQQTLPSFLYLPQEHERAHGEFDLPWRGQAATAVGAWAREQAALAPERTVGGAKSWLAHAQVGRRDPILPWGAPDDVPKVSPVTASRHYLEHLIGAWNQAFPEAPFEQQQIVLTVPASFDASACELTREAALAAGFPPSFVLLEEPQAALYAWLHDAGDAWRSQVHVGDRLLVCDVGGGTTDLSLIEVAEEQGQLALRRLAVGNHLLVGGDNMDLALAHYAAEQFSRDGVALDAWQSVSLWHSCRDAKEVLLDDRGPETHPLSVLGRGTRLIGGTRSIELARDQVSRLLVDGFFPLCAIGDRPTRRRQSGFVQLGLPFETDTAITRHVANFLTTHGAAEESHAPRFVLFNGGVFRSSRLRERMLEALGQWFPQRAPQELAGHHDLDFAVARGAAHYSWTKQHGAVRIRGGTARSYYIGIETAGLAIPGAPRPLKALCVVPFGMEEGTQIDVPASETGLILGEPVEFRFFSSSVRKSDRPGQLLDRIVEEELQETDSLETCLPVGTSSEAEGLTHVPVRLQSRVTELGVFELWCVSTQSDDQWKLSFNVREK